MEIKNLVANVQHSLHPTKSEGSHQTKLVDSNMSETKKFNLQNIERQVSGDRSISNEKEIKQKIQDITEQLNKEMHILNTTIRFGFDDKVDEMYVTVIDTQDNKIIRQIPSKEAIELAAKMKELVGMLFDEKG